MNLNKTILTSAAVVIFLLVLYVVFTPNAHAQFRPCVWPNTCLG